MKKISKILALVVLAGLFAAPALAERPRDGHHKKKEVIFMNPRILEKVAEKINLDDATLETIKNKIYQNKKQAIGLKSKLDTKKLDLRHELDSKSPDRGQVMKLLDETGALQTKLKKHRIGVMLDIRSMLTPKQIKQMKKLGRGFRENHKRRGDRKYRAGGRYLDNRAGEGGDGR